MESLALRFNVTLAYLLGDSDDRSVPQPAEKSEQQAEESLMMQLARLSPESRRIVSAAIKEAFRYDRERGMLKPEDEVKLTL